MRINVLECGARGDGATDNTDAIQAAIINGRPAKSQLYIDGKDYSTCLNICLEGEMPACLLCAYSLAPDTRLLGRPKFNTCLISTWEAPEQTDPAARPYSLLSTVEGNKFQGKFGIALVTLKNLDFRGFMNPKKMYPTASCVNLHHTSRCIVQDCQFGLDKNVGDLELGLELQPYPSHTAVRRIQAFGLQHALWRLRPRQPHSRPPEMACRLADARQLLPRGRRGTYGNIALSLM